MPFFIGRRADIRQSVLRASRIDRHKIVVAERLGIHADVVGDDRGESRRPVLLDVDLREVRYQRNAWGFGVTQHRNREISHCLGRTGLHANLNRGVTRELPIGRSKYQRAPDSLNGPVLGLNRDRIKLNDIAVRVFELTQDASERNHQLRFACPEFEGEFSRQFLSRIDRDGQRSQLTEAAHVLGRGIINGDLLVGRIDSDRRLRGD